MSAWWLLVPVVAPVCFGLACYWIKPLHDMRRQRKFLMLALLVNLAAVGGMCALPDGGIRLLHLTEGLSLYLHLDAAARFFCLLVAVMFLLVGLYALEYLERDKARPRFYLFYLIVLGLLNGIGLSGNFLTLYFFFEVMSLLSVPLVLHTQTKESVAAAFKYLFYSIGGASLALIGFFLLYPVGGALDFAPGGVLSLSNDTVLVASMLIISGFGVKAGMFPLHAWLPAAHPAAPAPASAVLSGVITKAGVLAVFRYVFFVAGADNIRGSWVQIVWMCLALVSILMGSMLAFKEPVLKKRFAYSSIGQVSYILFGMATLSETAVVGALFHVVVHSILKNGVFLASGAMIHQTGKTQISELRGIGKKMPLTLGCFAFISLGLIGIPPTGGFLSKWLLSTGSLAAETGFFSWLGPVCLLASALLAAGYLLPVVVGGFFPGTEIKPEPRAEVGWRMAAPMVILALLAVISGVAAGPLLQFLTRMVGGLL